MQKTREKIRPPKGGQNLVKVLAICHLRSKCKFYGNDIEYKKLTKKRVKKILKYSDGYCYDTLEKFHVKNNKVDKVYFCW